jgi:hypothetical protein
MNYHLTAVRRNGRWYSRIKHPSVPLVIGCSGAQTVSIAKQLLGVVDQPVPRGIA